MIGVDTNVVLRYLIPLDDPAQSAAARAFVERSAENGEHLFVNRIVLCEMFWVLDRRYRLPREVIVGVFDALLASAEFRVEDENFLRHAVADYEARRVDIADGLLARTNASAGCTTTVTFDEEAIRGGMFSAPR